MSYFEHVGHGWFKNQMQYTSFYMYFKNEMEFSPFVKGKKVHVKLILDNVCSARDPKEVKNW